jgi:hypothetical protein
MKQQGAWAVVQERGCERNSAARLISNEIMRGAGFRRRVDARGEEVAKEWLPGGYENRRQPP